MTTRIVKYAQDDFYDEYDEMEAPQEVIDEAREKLNTLEKWEDKKKFLEEMKDMGGDGSPLYDWASDMEDDVLDELNEIIWRKAYNIMKDKAKEIGGGHHVELFIQAMEDYLSLEDIARRTVLEVWKGADADKVLNEKLDENISNVQQQILYDVQDELKHQIDYESTRDTVRHMQTPEEFARIETPTEPKKLENVPEDQGLGSVSSKKNKMNKRGGKMLVRLFKLANVLDKKGEYELASDVDEVIKELSQRAGLTANDIVSIANELDSNGEYELADKLDDVLAKPIIKSVVKK